MSGPGGRGGSIGAHQLRGGSDRLCEHVAHYVAAKHGVIGLMKTLALELAPDMIRVNALCPTQVDTPMIMNEPTYRLFDPAAEHPTRGELRAGLAVAQCAADPVGRTRRHLQRAAVSGLRRGAGISPVSRFPSTLGAVIK